MRKTLKIGSRIALSLVLVCGLSPQLALADTLDSDETEQTQGVGAETDSALDAPDDAQTGANSLENDGLGSASESDGGDDGVDTDQSKPKDNNAEDSSKEGLPSQDELNVTSQPSKESMQVAIETLDTLEASSGISLMSTNSLDGVSPRSANTIEEYSGATRFEVACGVAEAAYPNGATKAIIAGSEGWADALSATSLAGVLDCPILLTDQGSLTNATKESLQKLGVTSVIVVGGPDTVSASVESQLKSAGIAVEKRLGGADRFEVQMNIFNYAKDKWDTSMIIVASGVKFSDALSSSPLAFSRKVPIFLVDDGGNLSNAQKATIGGLASIGGVQQSIIVGGPDSVSSNTETFLDGVTRGGSGGKNDAVRLGGADRYEASANFAKWAVEQGYLKWDGSAFTTGERPYDALTGSVLQGKDGAAMLLVNGTGSPTVNAFISGNPSAVKFFGGTVSVPSSWRAYIMEQMDLVISYGMPISLDSMVNAQAAVNGASKQTLLDALNPASYPYGSVGFYQFANVSEGYSGKVSAGQINAFLKSVCDAAGHHNSTLLGQGEAIVSAAKKYNVNEVYLLAHAILESGWGTSALSQGAVKGYEGYYNFYGIGAYDRDPENGGAYLAKVNGWNTPAKALDGAAKWISDNYLSEGQNTLYKMRWNIINGAASHQYASDPQWASSISRVMNQIYGYCGLEIGDTGLTFLYPVYR